MVNIKTKRFTFVAAIGACLATLISFALGFGRSVWFDEGYSIIVLDQPFDRMMALLKVDVHPPLYYLLLRGWTGIFGPSATSMRAMSCLFCGLTVLTMMALLRRLAGEKAALMTMPFLVAAPMLLRYGYEIRMYSLVPFLSVLGTYALLRAVDGERASDSDPRLHRTVQVHEWPWWLAYAVIVALGMYTQYMMALVWMTHLAWLCMCARRVGGFTALRRYLTPYVLAVVLYLPWLPSAIDQVAHDALPALKETMNLNELGSIFSVLVTGLNGSRLPSCVTVILIAMLALIITRAIRLHDAWRLRQNDETRAARNALATLAFFRLHADGHATADVCGQGTFHLPIRFLHHALHHSLRAVLLCVHRPDLFVYGDRIRARWDTGRASRLCPFHTPLGGLVDHDGAAGGRVNRLRVPRQLHL